jgi:nicotinamidase-related amidase
MSNANALFLNPAESLLLVVDLQEKFVPYLKHSKRVLQSTGLLLRVAKVMNIPVVASEHNPEGIGPTVPEIAKHLEGAEVIRKDIFSCLRDPKIKAAVARRQDAKTLILAGCETHVCIMQTSLDAIELGYNVHVAADGVSSRAELDWQMGLERIGKAGGVIATSEMIAYELLGRSDTPEFKKLLPVFKEWSKREP